MKLDGNLVLHGSTTSPFVRKVRLALLEKGIEHRFALAPPWSPTGGVDKLNPLHKVPVLELDDGTLVFDSRVIVQYLEARQRNPPLFPQSPSKRIQAMQVEAVADGVGEAVALYTQEGWRAPAAQSAYWLERQMAKVVAGIGALEKSIEPWLPAGVPVQLPSIAAGVALGFVDFWMPKLEWRAPAPRLAALSEHLEHLPHWQQTRPQLPPGATFPSL